MPATLHAHLKRRLDCADLYLDSAPVIRDGARQHRDPAAEAAKRLRVEAIASQYLQGKVPLILSASLRGPFHHGWKNPWAKPDKRQRSVSDKENGLRSKAETQASNSAQAKRRTRSAGRSALQEQTVASPETARAAHSPAAEFQESHTQDFIEVPPATAPSPKEDDSSVATEFSRVDTERCIRRQSPLTDPFWLRRPASQRTLDRRTCIQGNTDASPLRSRDTIARPDKRQALQLAVPKVPVGLCLPRTSTAVSEDIRSGASASMLISSPAKPAAPIENTTDPTSTSRSHRPTAPPTQTPGPAPALDPVQAQSAVAPLSIHVPATIHRAPSADQPPPNAHTIKDDQPFNDTRERNRVPIPDSSAGFVYKKVGSTKWSISNAPRSKPRAVNINSSPATKDAGTTSKPGSQKHTIIKRDAPAVQAVRAEESPRLGKPKSASQADEPVIEQPSLQSSHSSCQSAMSTRAAMLLAQLEFQESTFPISSSASLRPWSQPQEDTPRPMLPEPSPAITPLSIFRPQLEHSPSLTSVLRGPQLGTQDLFATASPFACSSAKKKPEALQQSTLGTSIGGRDDRVSNISPQSPSQSARIPLKDKNVVPSPWRFSFEKRRRKSQESFHGSARLCTRDVELPQLDIDTSSEEHGLTGYLHLADGRLHSMEDT